MKSSVSTEKHNFILNYKFGGISHFHHPGKHNEQMIKRSILGSYFFIHFNYSAWMRENKGAGYCNTSSNRVRHVRLHNPHKLPSKFLRPIPSRTSKGSLKKEATVCLRSMLMANPFNISCTAGNRLISMSLLSLSLMTASRAYFIYALCARPVSSHVQNPV